MNSGLDTEIADVAITDKIHVIRTSKVLLDYDLAELYGVQTKVLKQAVRRNLNRFPEDFMFVLTDEEFNHLRSQIVTSNHGGHRYTPMAFTEHGVLMLSTVLRSERAVEVNIRIMRVFTKMKKALAQHQGLLLKVEEIERQVDGHDEMIQLLFRYLKEIAEKKKAPRRQIGFKHKN